MKALDKLIEFLNNLNCGSKFMGIIIAILCFFLDLKLRKHNIHVPTLVRCIYFSVGICSVILLTDDIIKKIESCIKKSKIKKSADTKLLNKTNSLYKVVVPVLEKMHDSEICILEHFYKQSSAIITEEYYTIINKNSNTSCRTDCIVEDIQEKLSPLGLDIKITDTKTHYVLEIDKLYFNIICKYFSK